MKAVLDEAGMTFENIVKTTIFIMDMNDYKKNKQRLRYISMKTAPARETVQVACLFAKKCKC
jgi:2-iminobutanoate/2-iminopropanoate deaminase